MKKKNTWPSWSLFFIVVNVINATINTRRIKGHHGLCDFEEERKQKEMEWCIQEENKRDQNKINSGKNREKETITGRIEVLLEKDRKRTMNQIKKLVLQDVKFITNKMLQTFVWKGRRTTKENVAQKVIPPQNAITTREANFAIVYLFLKKKTRILRNGLVCHKSWIIQRWKS